MTFLRFPNYAQNNSTTSQNSKYLGKIVCVAIAATFVCGSTARSEMMTMDNLDASYSINISEKLSKLTDPENDILMMREAWDVASQRQVERNMPWVEIMNDATSCFNLTRFTMTIGDSDFHFGNQLMSNYILLSGTSDVMNVTATTENNEDLLVLDFGGAGLAPGQKIQFKLDIDSDPNSGVGWNFPDFRTVLFDMNGIQVYDGLAFSNSSSDNSEVTATFGSGSESATTTDRLPDYSVFGNQATIFNEQFRPNHFMEGIDAFPLTGGMNLIPEPNGCLLAMIGLLLASSSTRGSRGLKRFSC